MYYDRQGNQISLSEFTKLHDNNYKRVLQTTLPNGKWVSTVWLGINHQFSNGPILIFETMVFNSKGNFSDELDMKRYSTENDAIIGHYKMIEKWTA